MTPATLARLHALSFTTPRPWSEAEFAGFLSQPQSFLLTEGDSFLLGRVIVDEAELLTLATPPEQRGRGAAKRLVAAFLEQARQRGAASAFLEVAADNAPARHIYAAAGFTESGTRRGYYRSPEGRPIDAIVMTCTP
ncbi:GNAT family N-acetyltransferase [Paragemmobacter straminiformis]|uniref:GNAT family N-acetyltransferase n=1 Tax=Paragemmobacter straminiformis TaxID=2045119 RepID=A0A842IBI7_9RHOB|nr:GNAT family N-acetyltransferase [Gemmobacter straminiformis]MBC2836358.1 GNAT family N-acetyltransferase [Gemmobacter straminiformis]